MENLSQQEAAEIASVPIGVDLMLEDAGERICVRFLSLFFVCSINDAGELHTIEGSMKQS